MSEGAKGFSMSRRTVLAAAAAVAAVGVAWFLLKRADDADDEEFEESGTPVEAPEEVTKPVKATPSGGAGSGAGSESAASSTAGAGAGDDDVISKKELLDVLESMYARIQVMQVSLKEAIDAGELEGEQEIQKAHNDGMANMEQALHEKFGISAESLAKAQDVYAADSQVQAAKLKLRSLFDIGVPDAGEVPDDVTADQFVEKFKLQIEMTNEVFDEAYQATKALGLKGEEAMSHFRDLILPRLGEVQEASLKKMELTEAQFTGLLAKYQAVDPRVGQLFMQMQRTQQQRTQELLGL